MNNTTRRDGFSLIELLVVMTVLGVLATVVVFAIGGLRSPTESSACAADRRSLYTSTEAYFVRFGTDAIPAAPGDATSETYETTLVEQGLMRETSEFHDLNSSGELVQVAGSPCTV